MPTVCLESTSSVVVFRPPADRYHQWPSRGACRMTKGRVWEADHRRTAVPIFVSGLSRLVVSVARPDYDEPEDGQ